MKAPSKPGTVVKPATPQSPLPGTVEIYHSQDVKQSANYQSAGAVYGIKIVCHDNPKAISAAIQRAEEIVETALIDKVATHQALLKKLG